MMKVEEALLLLSSSKRKEMTLKEAVEIIEMVTRDPEVIKHILSEAEERGLIRREGKMVYIAEGVSSLHKPRVKRFDCDSSCRRCGIRIKNCFYILIDDRKLGPYGSVCVNKVL
ncbi:MAG: DUF5830 family protein [Candidatus Hydrothermarchaeales archaeon]